MELGPARQRALKMINRQLLKGSEQQAKAFQALCRQSVACRPDARQKPFRLKGAIATAPAPRNALLVQRSRFIVATHELDAEKLPPAELLAAYKQQSRVKKGFRFLKAPLFLASSLFLKLPQRLMALRMVMTLCLLVYSALEYRMRQALTTHQQTFPDQKGKPTSNLTARWAFQCFVGIHPLVLQEAEELVLNLEEYHQRLLALVGTRYETIYS